MSEPWAEAVGAILTEMHGKVISSEADAQQRLITPCLKAIGWPVTHENIEVWLSLTEPMARIWNYSSGRMRRDYVLQPRAGLPIHVEAKHRWPRFSFDMDRFLDRINRDDWTDTTKDGPKKDLALVLWGARSQGGRRAALWDESRVVVFAWDAEWRLTDECQIFVDRRLEVLRVLGLLAPDGGEA